MANSASASIHDENIEPRPLMTFETPLLYCVPAPMKEKDTGAVTLPSGSDPTNVPSTSPYKYANPIYLLSTSQAPNGIETRKAQVPPSSLLKDGNLEYFVSSSEPPSNVETSNTDSASADEILSTVAHLSDSEPSNDIETINTDSASIDEVVSTINYISDCESPNGNGIFLHIDPDHTDQLSELDSELYSESTNVIPKTFEWFPDLPAEIRLKIWNLALGGPRTIKINFKISPRFVPGQHNTRSKRKPKEVVIQHICFSTLTIEPLGASNVFDWLMAKARQAQSETSSFPPISLLRVCQESRHQATRRLPRYISLPGTGEKLYYQPGLDRVYFDERTYRNTILGHTSQRLGGKFKPILGSETLDGIPPDRCFIGSWGIVDMDRYLNTFRKRPNKPQFAWIRGPPKPSLRGRLSPRTLLTRVRALFGVRNG